MDDQDQSDEMIYMSFAVSVIIKDCEESVEISSQKEIYKPYV